MGKAVKVVFHTNVWVSFFLNKTLSKDLSKILTQEVTVYVSKDILAEISKVLTYPKITQILKNTDFTPRDILRAIAQNTCLVEPKTKITVITTDPEDNKILECSREADADFIVTGDNHLLKLQEFNRTKILSPRDFINHYFAQK